MPASNVLDFRAQPSGVPTPDPVSGAPAPVPNLRDFRSPGEELARRTRVAPLPPGAGTALRSYAPDMSGVAERLAPKAAGFGMSDIARGAARVLGGPIATGAQMLMHSGSLNSGEDAELARLRAAGDAAFAAQGPTGYANGGMISGAEELEEIRRDARTAQQLREYSPDMSEVQKRLGGPNGDKLRAGAGPEFSPEDKMRLNPANAGPQRSLGVMPAPESVPSATGRYVVSPAAEAAADTWGNRAANAAKAAGRAVGGLSKVAGGVGGMLMAYAPEAGAGEMEQLAVQRAKGDAAARPASIQGGGGAGRGSVNPALADPAPRAAVEPLPPARGPMQAPRVVGGRAPAAQPSGRGMVPNEEDQMPVVIKDGNAYIGNSYAAPADVYWRGEAQGWNSGAGGGLGRQAIEAYQRKLQQVENTGFDEAINPGRREQGFKMEQLGAQGEAARDVAEITATGKVTDAAIAADATRHENQRKITKEQAEKAEKLHDDHKGESKDFVLVRDAYSRVKKSLETSTKSAPAALAGATSFMKLLDPGSVVRESELGMALQASGVLDRLTNYHQTLANGKVLTPLQAKEFARVADLVYNAQAANQRQLDEQYTQRATRLGLNPRDVITDYYYKPDGAGGAAGSKPGAAAAPGGAKPPPPVLKAGTVDGGYRYKGSGDPKDQKNWEPVQ